MELILDLLFAILLFCGLPLLLTKLDSNMSDEAKEEYEWHSQYDEKED